MEIKIAYGKTGLKVILHDNLHVDSIEPNFVEGLCDEHASLTGSLRSPSGSMPIFERVSSTDKIGIVFSDITRATPYPKILPPLLGELKHVPDVNIKLFNATGTHRFNTPEELNSILGPEHANRFRIIQNDCNDKSSHVKIGTTSSGNDIWVHEDFVNCTFKILTGFIEPHFFAGFSGGGKAVMPGLSLAETILKNHGPVNMDNPSSRWGITKGNPLWEETMEAALMLDNVFLLNVALNKKHEITGIFSGDIRMAHTEGCRFVKETAMVAVDNPYDVVITGNSGYPLDLNFYQSVKGMSAAAQILKPGGDIIMAADCWDGIPEHGEFGKILKESENIDEMLEYVRNPEIRRQDLWQCHILGLICKKARIFFYSDNLTEKQIRSGFCIPCKSLERTIQRIVSEKGEQIRICVLPEGPQTIPYLSRE